MFRVAHLTDPHVGPLPRPRLRELLNKRLTGFVNWRRNRKDAHDMLILAALVADMHEQNPDHIACTGDLCNIGLPSEWRTSRVFMEGLGPPDRVSLVPGNHDAYIPGSLEGLVQECAPWIVGDGAQAPRFPYVRRRGPVALIGMSSAVPTPPFVATGKVGRTQMRATEAILAEVGREPGCFRIVMIHHPPHLAGAPAGRNLTDARAFEAMIARTGAELVIHGHMHVGSVAFVQGPRGLVPVVGATSASARGGTLTHRAGYHLYTIDPDAAGPRVTGELRGLTDDGGIAHIEAMNLTLEWPRGRKARAG
jgi:3',5'-cyclic AMP phosphodiesterase CpdA